MSYIMQEDRTHKIKHKDLAEKSIKASIRASEGDLMDATSANSADIALIEAHMKDMHIGGMYWTNANNTIAAIKAGKRRYDGGQLRDCRRTPQQKTA